MLRSNTCHKGRVGIWSISKVLVTISISISIWIVTRTTTRATSSWVLWLNKYTKLINVIWIYKYSKTYLKRIKYRPSVLWGIKNWL